MASCEGARAPAFSSSVTSWAAFSSASAVDLAERKAIRPTTISSPTTTAVDDVERAALLRRLGLLHRAHDWLTSARGSSGCFHEGLRIR